VIVDGNNFDAEESDIHEKLESPAWVTEFPEMPAGHLGLRIQARKPGPPHDPQMGPERIMAVGQSSDTKGALVAFHVDAPEFVKPNIDAPGQAKGLGRTICIAIYADMTAPDDNTYRCERCNGGIVLCGENPICLE
jgi:hypothetical protein